jgi:predicted phage baseplate assembly protein
MLPAPSLDDRRFQELVDDAKRLVMRRCPEWTDHNVSDPGVTLIETFAYMTDALLYRLNRLPDRLYVKFLDMIGLRMFPATAARVPVTFWLASPQEAMFTVPATTEVATAGTEQVEPVVFSTGRDLALVPCRVVGLATCGAGEVPVDQTGPLEMGSPVAVFSTPPRVGDVVCVGLDTSVPECAVRLDALAQAEGVGVNPKRPPLVWEAWCGDAWVVCDVTGDETGGLNQPGNLVVHVPAGHSVSVLAEQACGWLRARVTEPLEGQPPYSASPVLRGVSGCTVGGTTTAVNAQVVLAESLGEAEGVPGQRFRLGRSPVLSGVTEQTVEVSSETGWEPWERVEHFANSSPDDRHYVLDAYAGDLVFGPLVRLEDGGVKQYGAVPAAGSTVRVLDYAVGGGPQGNVAAHSITALRSSSPFVSGVDNRNAATGGTDGETLERAMQRGPLMLRTRDRAVTAEDYELLAREAAPEVARVHCVPADGDLVPAGSVKVLVVPAAPSVGGRVDLGDLIPAGESLERIAARLDETRVAGVRVLLEPPRYRGVTVVARLIARPRVKAADVTDAALETLYRFLCPLPGGGPDGEGWPFGRPVQQGELFAALRDVRGVEMVEDLRLYGADPVTGRRGAEETRLNLDTHSLVFSFEHQVLVEEH